MTLKPDDKPSPGEETPRVSQRKRIGWRWVILLLPVLIGASIAYRIISTSKVMVVKPTFRDIVQTLTVTGYVRGAQESALSPEQAGILAELSVEEGDRVKVGQVLARISSTVLIAEQAQALAAVRSAEAQLTQTRAEARVVESQQSQARAEVNGAEREAVARLEQARARLRELEAGGTSESRSEAAAAVHEAEAGVTRANSLLASAERELKRQEDLFARSAVGRVMVDSARTEAETARTELTRAKGALQAALARQKTVASPARAELIEQQNSAIRAAEAAVTTARQAGKARIESLNRTPNTERESVALRRLEEAHRALDTILVRTKTTVVRAPFEGIITDVLVRPGTAVGPIQPLLRLADMREAEIIIDVDERDLARVAVGQIATLLLEADPNRPVKAHVTLIGNRADTQRGVVKVTLLPTEPAPWLRSGMTVDATIVVEKQTHRLVIPTSAIRRDGDETTVLVVENGRVAERLITLGNGETGSVVVFSGLSENDIVVTEPAETRLGAKVKPVLSDGEKPIKGL